MRSWSFSSLIVAAAMAAGTASAQVTPVSALRTIDPAGQSSTAFGLFDETATVSIPTGSVAGPGSRTAIQNSTLSASGAVFSLTSNGYGNTLTNGTSSLTYVFAAPAGTTYSLSGSIINIQGPPFGVQGWGTLSLVGPGLNLQIGDVNRFTSNVPFSASGALSGGQYTLTILTYGSGATQQSQHWTGSGRVVGELVLVPAPGAATLGLGVLGMMRRRR